MTEKAGLTYEARVKDVNFKKTFKDMQTQSANISKSLDKIGNTEFKGLEKSMTEALKELEKIKRGLNDLDDTELEETLSASVEELEKMEKRVDIVNRTLEDGENVLQTMTYYVDDLGNEFDETGTLIKSAVDKAEDLKREMAAIEDEAYEMNAAFSKSKREMDGLDSAASGVEKELSDAASEADGLDSALSGADNELKSMESRSKKLGENLKKTGEGMTKVGDFLTKSVTAPVLGLTAVATGGQDELRQALAKLETKQARDNKDIDMGSINDAMRLFASVGSDVDASAEATSLLLEFSRNNAEFLEATKMIAGAVVRFPDAVTVEGIAESMNEALKTGEVSGQYGDLLEWTGASFDKDALQGVIDGLTTVEIEVPPVDIQLIDTDRIKDNRRSEDSNIKNRRAEEDKALERKRAEENLKLSKEQLQAIKDNRRAEDNAIKERRRAEDDQLKAQRQAEDARNKAENALLSDKIKSEEEKRKNEIEALKAQQEKQLLRDSQDDIRDEIMGGMSNGESDFGADYEQYDELNGDLVDSKIAAYDLQLALKDLGDSLLPVLTEFTRMGTELLNMFNSLDDETKDLIITAVGYFVAFGPALSTLGRFVGTISSIVTAISTFKATAAVAGTTAAAAGTTATVGFLPLVGIILGIIAVVGILIYTIYKLVENWEVVKEQTGRALLFIKDSFLNLINAIKDIMGNLTKAFLADGGKIGVNFILGIINGIKQVVPLLIDFVGKLVQGIIGQFNAVFKGKHTDLNLNGDYTSQVRETVDVNMRNSDGRSSSQEVPSKKQPMIANFKIGKRGFQGIVEDINNVNNRNSEYEMSF